LYIKATNPRLREKRDIDSLISNRAPIFF